MEEMYKYS